MSNFGSSLVSVIDSTSNSVVATIPVDRAPSDLEFNPFNSKIYVAHSGGGTGASVDVIDSTTNTVTAKVPIGKSTFALEFSPFNNNMYVSTSGLTATNVVEVIDSTSNTVIDAVTVGNLPEHLKFNPVNNHIYTANRGSNTVSVIGIEVPDTIINNAIDGNNNVLDNGDTSTSDSITFTFSGSFDGSPGPVDGFECSLDGLEFENCSTGSKTYTGLSTGNHEFKVKAFVLDTNDKKIFDSTPASFNWIISIVTDTTPPETQILSATDGNGKQLNEGDKTSSNSITFEFNGQDETSVQENLIFECSLDSAIFEQCTSPLNINSLSSGEHTFAVRAIDEAGNTDQSSADFTWIVDNSPPETEITSVEDGQGTELFNSDTTVSPTISISFTGSDDLALQQNLIFECSLDLATFEQCTSPYVKEDLEFGEHTFAVRAIDEVGNTDQTPDEFTWTILTLSEGVTEIETIIEDLNLPQGVENSLKAQLSQSTRILNDNNPNNDIAVCDKLDSFILEVDEKFFNGKLSSEDATLLIAKANAISNELGC